MLPARGPGYEAPERGPNADGAYLPFGGGGFGVIPRFGEGYEFPREEPEGCFVGEGMGSREDMVAQSIEEVITLGVVEVESFKEFVPPSCPVRG